MLVFISEEMGVNKMSFLIPPPPPPLQVAEVISKEKCRLSVSGWFHGPSVARPTRPVELLPPRSPHIPCSVSDLHSVHDTCGFEQRSAFECSTTLYTWVGTTSSHRFLTTWWTVGGETALLCQGLSFLRIPSKD